MGGNDDDDDNNTNNNKNNVDCTSGASSVASTTTSAASTASASSAAGSGDGRSAKGSEDAASKKQEQLQKTTQLVFCASVHIFGFNSADIPVEKRSELVEYSQFVVEEVRKLTSSIGATLTEFHGDSFLVCAQIRNIKKTKVPTKFAIGLMNLAGAVQTLYNNLFPRHARRVVLTAGLAFGRARVLRLSGESSLARPVSFIGPCFQEAVYVERFVRYSYRKIPNETLRRAPAVAMLPHVIGFFAPRYHIFEAAQTYAMGFMRNRILYGETPVDLPSIDRLLEAKRVKRTTLLVPADSYGNFVQPMDWDDDDFTEEKLMQQMQQQHQQVRQQPQHQPSLPQIFQPHAVVTMIPMQMNRMPQQQQQHQQQVQQLQLQPQHQQHQQMLHRNGSNPAVYSNNGERRGEQSVSPPHQSFSHASRHNNSDDNNNITNNKIEYTGHNNDANNISSNNNNNLTMASAQTFLQRQQELQYQQQQLKVQQQQLQLQQQQIQMQMQRARVQHEQEFQHPHQELQPHQMQ